MTNKFENWLLREWRVNPEKDKPKAQGNEYDYKKLKDNWKNRLGSIIDFWLDNDPNWTIPPYQDNNNRRPPKCQSLVFNTDYLDKKYPKWQEWVSELKKCVKKDYLNDYEDGLKELKSGKGRSYFEDHMEGELRKDSCRRNLKQLDARILHFILDRAKAQDTLELNEIYSHAKKIKQIQSTEQEKGSAKTSLNNALSTSDLPESLKTSVDYEDDAIFLMGSFFHLVCKYYKVRQRAREGRVFIHPEYREMKGRGYENTGRFDGKNHLLTYCNHKPRQKRYQLIGDVAGVLQLSIKDLKNFIQDKDGESSDEKILSWLSGIDSLKTNCERAAKEQKERRGRLKLDIQNIFDIIHYRRNNENLTDKKVKLILKNNDRFKLYTFCQRAKKLCENLMYDFAKQEQWKDSLERNPASAVYILAQIHNVAFKDRSGNSKTCAVCSTDNAHRMETTTNNDGKTLGKSPTASCNFHTIDRWSSYAYGSNCRQCHCSRQVDECKKRIGRRVRCINSHHH